MGRTQTWNQAYTLAANHNLVLGLLVPPADPTALSMAIKSLLGDPALATGLALAGQARVRVEFSAAKMVGQVMQVYDELLARGERRNGRR